MWKKLLRGFRSVFKKIWPKIQNAAELAVERYGEEFFDVVLKVINEVQKSDKSGKEKREMAIDALVAFLQSKGQEVFMDTINFVLESQIPNKTK